MLRLELPATEAYFDNGLTEVEKIKVEMEKNNLLDQEEYYYSGYLLNNKPHKKGTLYRIDNNEMVFDGEFNEGKITGHGAYYEPGEVLKYLGVFNEGGYFEGQGAVYEKGEIKSHGIYKKGLIQSGTHYVIEAYKIGNFTYGLNDKVPQLTGKGMIKFVNGGSITGTFSAGLLHETCVVDDPNGTVFEKIYPGSKLPKEQLPVKYTLFAHHGYIIKTHKYECADYTLESLESIEEKIPESYQNVITTNNIYKKTTKNGTVSYVVIGETFKAHCFNMFITL